MNCLVQTLKGNVDNTELLRFNSIRVISGSGLVNFGINTEDANNPGVVTVNSGVIKDRNDNVVSSPHTFPTAYEQLLKADANTILDLYPKFDFTTVLIYGSSSGTKADIIDVDFSKIVSLKTLQLSNNNYELVVDSLGTLISLETLVLINMSNTSGSIEQLCTNLVLNGKTSGTLVMSLQDIGVTYLGNIITSRTNLTATFNASYPDGYNITVN